MNTHGSLDHLFDKARRETPPRVDVADRVIARLRGEAAPEPHPLAWIAAAASLAAAAVCIMAWVSWQTSLDPVAEVLYLAGGVL